MTGPTLRTMAIAVALVLLGWVAGRAQAPAQPDFEFTVSAPEGQTIVECVRGCELQWVARGVNPDATPRATFEFRCQNSPSGRCGSGRIGGWVRP
jgi:hypothetical protein